MRVHLTTLGCRLNEAELETWSRQFRARGFALTTAADAADLLVINSCAVTAEAVRKSRKLIRRARRNNPAVRLVLSGCYASLGSAGPPPEVDLVVVNRDKERLVSIAIERLGLAPAEPTGESLSGPIPGARHRAFIKVQDGCRYRCSYCIVTLARGAERSRPIDAVIDEIEQRRAEGYREVVLTGVHLGGYGHDLGSDLHRLVATVLEHSPIERVRLGSLEPWDLPDALWGLFAEPRLQPHLHLPLQSGCDSVLRRMARRGRVVDFERLVERGRTKVPELNLTSDIIVGFPGESDREWAETLAAVRRIGFGDLHVFPFSPRPGTRAATLPDPVPAELIRKRSGALRDLTKGLLAAAQQREIGQRRDVLFEVEDRDHAGEWLGYGGNFFRVRVASGEPLADRIEKIEIVARDRDGLLRGRRVAGG